MNNVRGAYLLTIFLVFLVSARAHGQGTTRTVVPYGLESQEGSGTDFTFANATDRQQWIRSSYLNQIWDSPVFITGVAFRADESVLSEINTTIPHVEIWLATSRSDAADLQSYEINAGSDSLQVFSSDAVRIDAPGGGSPNPFAIRFEFSRPFFYDTDGGHLLMRLLTQGDFEGRVIDRHGFGDISTTPMAIPQSGPMGFPEARGLVMEFSWRAIPEPSYLLYAYWVTLMFAGGRRRE